MTPENHSFEDVFVARQPIFDRARATWGYELLFRRAAADTAAGITDPDAATAQVIADGYSIAVASLPSNAMMLINYPRNLIVQGAPFALPKERCMVEILETVTPEPAVLDALTEMKRHGYRLALDDFVGDPGFEPLLELADLVKVDVMNMRPPDILRVTKKLKRHDVALLAEKVEDKQTLQLTRSLGYAYFQGYFFSKPEIVPGRRISSSQATQFKLLRQIHRKDAAMNTIAAIVSNDPGLSHRLLQFTNAAAFRRSEHIQGVDHALPMLGLRAVTMWLTAVILSDMATSPGADELARISVRRGKYLELLGSLSSQTEYKPETLFLLGLFSKLDTLLSLPMGDIVKQLPLSNDLVLALMGEKSSAAQWLDHCRHMEQADWGSVQDFLQRIAITMQKSAELYAQAATWAHGMVEHTNPPS